jgi:hypothetical protein
MSATIVRTKELRAAFDALMMHLESTGHAEIAVDDDYYWFVPRESRYDPQQQPTELTIGQLSDDAREIRAIADGSKEPIGYALVWLAALLTHFGEDVP